MAQSPNREKFLTGLIGAPIAQSAAPAMHEQAAEALGARCHYQLIEVAGADPAELRALLDGVRRLGFAGVNVTFPYKEAVVPLLDEMSPGASAIGAVNTVVVRDGRLIGHNTDTTGFERVIVDKVDGQYHVSLNDGGENLSNFSDKSRTAASPRVSISFRVDSTMARTLASSKSASSMPIASRRNDWQCNCAAVWKRGSPMTSRMRCRALPAWSTERRSACCRIVAWPCQRRCCIAICG